jgi:hypothetical protein
MDQRIEVFLADILALRDEEPDLIRDALDGFVLTVLIITAIGTLYYTVRLVKELRRSIRSFHDRSEDCLFVRDAVGSRTSSGGGVRATVGGHSRSPATRRDGRCWLRRQHTRSSPFRLKFLLERRTQVLVTTELPISLGHHQSGNREVDGDYTCRIESN